MQLHLGVALGHELLQLGDLLLILGELRLGDEEGLPWVGLGLGLGLGAPAMASVATVSIATVSTQEAKCGTAASRHTGPPLCDRCSHAAGTAVPQV
eukprot:scaffold19784_cov57-Phaeocystis_antarctica.AAC.6